MLHDDPVIIKPTCDTKDTPSPGTYVACSIKSYAKYDQNTRGHPLLEEGNPVAKKGGTQYATSRSALPATDALMRK